MSRLSTLILAATIVLGYLGLCLATQEWGFGKAENGPRYPYLLEDHYDRMAYQQRGRWLASGGRPYLDEMAEYPQLSVFFMGLPYLTFEHGVPEGEPFGAQARLRSYLLRRGLAPPRVAQLVERNGTLWESAENGRDAAPDPSLVANLAAAHQAVEAAELQALVDDYWGGVRERNEELKRNRLAYGDRHQILMGIFYLALIALAISNLVWLGHSPAWALLLCLPASLYFGFNRYDMVVTALVAGAFWFQLRAAPDSSAKPAAQGRSGYAAAAGAMLGLAIMAKWFPVVFVPLFVSQNLRRSHAAARARGQAWRVGPALLHGALLPGLCTGLVCLVFLGWSFLYKDGGLAAVMELPHWHSHVRQPNHASLLWKLTDPRDWAWFERDQRDGIERIFKILQLGPALLIALLPVRSNRSLILAALVATLCMMIFSEFFSPQWVIWVTALSLLLAPRWWRFGCLCVALELVCYLQLPVLYFRGFAAGGTMQTYYTAPAFEAFHTISNTRVALLFVFLAVALVSLVASLRARDDEGPSCDPGPGSAQPASMPAAYSTSASARSSSA